MIATLKRTFTTSDKTQNSSDQNESQALASDYGYSPVEERSYKPVFELMTAEERLQALYDKWGDKLVASTSFGIQSSVMLHLISKCLPQMPVIFIDTGFLFEETYRYAEKLTSIYNINLHVVTPVYSAARINAVFGNIWEQGEVEQNFYANMTKIEPMNRALNYLGAEAWMSGVRRSQSTSREDRPFIEQQNQIIKTYPILDWDDDEIEIYKSLNKLPAHPLEEKGYVTSGDTHSTKPLHEVSSIEETRFNGNKFECGLHIPSDNNSYKL